VLVLITSWYLELSCARLINKKGEYSVASKMIRPSQSALLPGRNILEGVVVLHETLHELLRKKQKGLILKLDFKKTYDKVN
jgi:hypothetical protein